MTLKNNEYMNGFENVKQPSQGACIAYQAWKQSVQDGLDEVELRESWNADHLADFAATLREAGLSSFVLTAKSTALLEDLHALQEAGCILGELCVVERLSRWMPGETEEAKGLRIAL